VIDRGPTAEFDEAYARVPDYFGDEPDELVVEHIELLPPQGRVLDLGCGQGRNSLWLAERRFAVDAIDPSAVSIRCVREAAERKGLTVNAICTDFESFDAERPYDAVLAMGLVPVLRRPQIGSLVQRVRAWLGIGRHLFITAFTTEDEAYERHRAQWREIGRNSFRSPDGGIRTYLDPGEIIRFFHDFAVVHHWEGLGPEHRHGDGPLHRHAVTDAVLRRGA
jgi:tellurite methyltransferase